MATGPGRPRLIVLPLFKKQPNSHGKLGCALSGDENGIPSKIASKIASERCSLKGHLQAATGSHQLDGARPEGPAATCENAAGLGSRRFLHFHCHFGCRVTRTFPRPLGHKPPRVRLEKASRRQSKLQKNRLRPRPGWRVRSALS